MSIIKEDHDRYTFNDLLIATAEITHNFNDAWISKNSSPDNYTSRYIVELLSEKGYKSTAGKLQHTSSLEDTSNVASKEQMILNYWKFRFEKSTDLSQRNEAQRRYNDLMQYTHRDKNSIPAFKIGDIAYSIWKACNSDELKKQQNLQDLADSGTDALNKYTYKQKINNLTLTLIGFKNEFGRKGQEFFLYGLDENGIKFKIKAGDSISYELLKRFCKEFTGKKVRDLPTGNNAIKMTLSGTVSKVTPEYKTVSLDNVVIASPTINEIDEIIRKSNADDTVEIERQAELLKPEVEEILSQIVIRDENYTEENAQDENDWDGLEEDDENARFFIKSMTGGSNGYILYKYIAPIIFENDNVKYNAYLKAFENSNNEFGKSLSRNIKLVRRIYKHKPL